MAISTSNFARFLFFIVINYSYCQNFATQINNIAINNDMMGGAVVVFCENQIINAHYFGKSDFQRNIALNENTKFRIASISKTITAIAIMQLVQQNLLDINQDVSQILGYPVKNPNFPQTNITTKMLLSHQSSIIDGPTYGSFLNATNSQNPIPNLSQILTPAGSFYHVNQFNSAMPGTYFNYSNINYVILGTIVEKVSNQRFDVFCKENILQPLLIDASFNVNDLQNIDQLAVLYRKTNNNWVPQVDNYLGIQPVFTNLSGYLPGTNGGRFAPQGGLRISAQDLAKLVMVLQNPLNFQPSILNNNTANLMKSQNWLYNGNNGNNYFGLFLKWGLGLHLTTNSPGQDVVLTGSQSMFGHTGEAYGLVSDAYFDPVRKVGLVIITNGVGVGYQTNSQSAFYTVEREIFDVIENHANVNSCLNLDVEDNNLSPYFKIYPNPVNDKINIYIENFEEYFQAIIIGADGKTVLTKYIRDNHTTIDVSTLSKGFYLVKIYQSVQTFIK